MLLLQGDWVITPSDWYQYQNNTCQSVSDKQPRSNTSLEWYWPSWQLFTSVCIRITLYGKSIVHARAAIYTNTHAHKHAQRWLIHKNWSTAGRVRLNWHLKKPVCLTTSLCYLSTGSFKYKRTNLYVTLFSWWYASSSKMKKPAKGTENTPISETHLVFVCCIQLGTHTHTHTHTNTERNITFH